MCVVEVLTEITSAAFAITAIDSSSGMLWRDRSAPMFAVSPLAEIRCFRPAMYSGVASAPMNGSSFVRVSRPVVS